MRVINEVYAKNEDLARAFKNHPGYRRIVEDLYPDSAHFIYELLQNAEDTGASEAHFVLSPSSLVFEHNGRPFEERDIYSITDIGESTKSKDDDKIGRFGVGFKAVFAYSETPHIWSPTFAFKITELVLPVEIPQRSDLGKRTRFEFPFNNPKKSSDEACKEVENCFSKLAETTLLFLSHLESIRWSVENTEQGEVLRHRHSENHIEVLKKIGGKTTTSQHFLKFQHPVVGLEKQQISVAFELDLLPNHPQFDPSNLLAKQMKIVPAASGRVAVFFPAEKETSGLRFHLHAPFVPELSRASIKETPANHPLFEQLASLTTASLYAIRDLKLLTGDFLAVLPNPQDAMPSRYEPIRKAIFEAMNEQPLTPTYSKTHAAAKHLLQAKASLKELLSEDDIKCLVSYEDEPPQWAIAATQRNSNSDRFLSGLSIASWDIEDFVDRIVHGMTETPRYNRAKVLFDADFVGWLAQKSVDWIQRMYAMLFTELSPTGDLYRLKYVKLVKLADGGFEVGSQCFFPDGSETRDDALPRVDGGILTTGKNKTLQERAKQFLIDLGVREVGEAEQVEAILKKRYTHEAEIPGDNIYRKDFKRFVALVERQPDKGPMFKDYYIFETERGHWERPTGIFLDDPFTPTGLRAYYGGLDEEARRAMLGKRYEDIGVSIKKVTKFVESVGVQKKLEVSQVSCRQNPQWNYLIAAPGNRSRFSIDSDYHIFHLEFLFKNPSIGLSRLVWQVLESMPPSTNYLRATYQWNGRDGARYADSQLVHLLRKAAWVPQGERFARPEEASPDLLPAGFPYDQGWVWLEAIHFGLHAAKKIEQNRIKEEAAKELGFSDLNSLERAKRFAAIPSDVQERILNEMERRAVPELPDQEPINPARRAERVEAKAAGAPERLTEERTRPVSVGRVEVKVEAEQYLLQQYTDNEGHLLCQLCKGRMPFKMDDGRDYFEKVELFPELKNRHYQNYLALCPNHAAMYQYVNGSKTDMLELFAAMSGNNLEIVLAKQPQAIYFTKMHIADLRTVIEAERGSNDECAEG